MDASLSIFVSVRVAWLTILMRECANTDAAVCTQSTNSETSFQEKPTRRYVIYSFSTSWRKARAVVRCVKRETANYKNLSCFQEETSNRTSRETRTLQAPRNDSEKGKERVYHDLLLHAQSLSYSGW